MLSSACVIGSDKTTCFGYQMDFGSGNHFHSLPSLMNTMNIRAKIRLIRVIR